MLKQPMPINKIEREAIYQIRELYAQGLEDSLTASDEQQYALIKQLAAKAVFPEKPFLPPFGQDQEAAEGFHMISRFAAKEKVGRLITCGGVDDGKSTLIGRILYDTKSKAEQGAIRANPAYLRVDGSVDYALLAGMTEEEARQGITVQVSYSTFDWANTSFLMADVPGHEEYTHNMAFAAAGADTAIIMVAANKGIVPQARRHTRICYFMGIRNFIFAVNKMDIMSCRESAFRQISEEAAQMMEAYTGCECQIIPVAAKSGINIIKPSIEMPWYSGGTLLDALQQAKAPKVTQAGYFCMPIQRVCKSSQMKGAVVKKRAIQGEVICGSLSPGDGVFVYPTAQRAKVSALYRMDQAAESVCTGDPVTVELDRELDTARGYILAGEDVLDATDRIEADLLWTLDNRLAQGKRYRLQIGTATQTAAVTKICYQVDVNTGEHRYAEYITKNGLARCELCFSKQLAVTREKESRALGTLRLYDRETGALAAYGNIIHTISEEAFKRDGRDVSALERESCMGQKAGLILFYPGSDTQEAMNYTERYLLRMGFHTMQALEGGGNGNNLQHIQSLLDAGLIVLALLDAQGRGKAEDLLEARERVFDCSGYALGEDIGHMLKRIREWASGLI
ncbi:hypothetical protein D3Z47_00475 [Lachnospiraceae bacterium]|jgi:sulfate adenylyltransferase large subunit|nr:hypothetical protein [Lachnospiraceae bacterium]